MCGSELQDADSAAFMLQRQQEHQRKISQLPPLINSGSPSNQEAESGANPATTKSSDRGGIFSTLTSTVTGSSRKNASDANTVKLSFRNGGSSGFQGHLKTAMVNRAWEAKPKPQSPTPARTQSSGTLGDATSPTPVAKVGGISGIIRTVETHQKETDQALTQAFQDLQGLMEMAAQMVTMTESISKRLSRSDSLNNEETATFRNYLLNMGIAAPVTKDTAGAVFHKELARELVEFALPIIEREGGTMSLVDIYCVFNRARGVELISPKDLNTACQMFEELNLPLRLRKFDSGLLVIQTLARYSDDEVAQSILGKIQSLPMGAPGLSAVELASAVQISVALATEQLLTTEALGMICRDESVEGLRFFDNLMARYELPLDGDL
ncbi:Vacuolar protein-sorting-associated protein 36 [Lunasporangiospora selenospora]|uniref:Vacuolar protein-sorting-associated protein 36 n=1 Tax=Lunasporangiospora selenospora TaxID=979761 RepID=A0A9P6FNI7_9FUNG|nr:Vacuolar protein-sorting-associated protein 36 [Lunasporangiospora selenospora]